MIMGGLVMMSMIDRGRPGEIRLVGLGNLPPVSLCWLEEPPRGFRVSIICLQLPLLGQVFLPLLSV